jgi:uncharacterized protein YkwD
MIRNMKAIIKSSFILLTCLLAFSLLGMGASPANIIAAKTPKNAGGNAYDLIAAVNQVRAANGLSAYQADGSLMASAQAHSDYQASIGSITHTGQGGSDVKSRAIVAGYGGGAAVSVIENIYGGTDATPQQAVNNWQGDSLHLNTLLSSKAVDVGAGVATDGSLMYYTLDVGYVVGSEGSGSNSGSVSSTSVGSTTSQATAITYNPIQVSTPNSDGSIIHIVQPGQTLWSIAATYKIDLLDLLDLNGFTSNTFIYPGQKITIKTPGVIPVESPVNTGSPKTTITVLEATFTISPLPVTEAALAETNKAETLTEQLTATPIPGRPSSSRTWTEPLIWVIAIFVLGGTSLMVAGSVLQRKK